MAGASFRRGRLRGPVRLHALFGSISVSSPDLGLECQRAILSRRAYYRWPRWTPRESEWLTLTQAVIQPPRPELTIVISAAGLLYPLVVP